MLQMPPCTLINIYTHDLHSRIVFFTGAYFSHASIFLSYHHSNHATSDRIPLVDLFSEVISQIPVNKKTEHDISTARTI